MDLRHVFASTAVILVVVVAAAYWMAFLNFSYGTDVGSSFNSTLSRVTTSISYELNSTSVAAGENTFAESGAAATTQQEGLLERSVSTFQQISPFFTLVPNLLQDAGTLLGLPQPYAGIAAWTFSFFLGIAIVLILVQAAQAVFR